MREQYEDGYYFCHNCNHRRLSEEVVPSATGDLRCMVCDNEGFVEKITVPTRSEPISGFRTHQQTTNVQGLPVMSVSQLQFSTGPSASVFDMPLGNVIQRVFSGIMSPMGAMATGGGISFHTIDAQGLDFTQQGPFQSLSENAQGILQAFMRNPLDPQAMNQFLHYVMENDPNREGGTPPAARAVLESLETEVLTEEQAKKLETCAICTEDFAEGDRIHWLCSDRKVCGHAFHVDCIVPWLKQHNSCPVCRYELPTDDAEYDRQRENLRSRLVEEVQRHVENPNQGNTAGRGYGVPEGTRSHPRRDSSGNGNTLQTSYCRVQ